MASALNCVAVEYTVSDQTVLKIVLIIISKVYCSTRQMSAWLKFTLQSPRGQSDRFLVLIFNGQIGRFLVSVEHILSRHL